MRAREEYAQRRRGAPAQSRRLNLERWPNDGPHWELQAGTYREIELPILGICLGHQLIAETFGGAVGKGASGGYAHVTVEIIEPDDILGMGPTINAWASHADEVSRLPNNFKKLARSAICEIEAMEHPSKPIYGVQWHPEVAHTEAGNTLLLNFLKICDEH